MEGWIKLQRKLLQWEWWDDHNATRLFIALLLSANHKAGWWHGILINPGQFVTGIHALHKMTGISHQSIRSVLTRLKSTSEITIKSTNKYSIITLINWDQYQCSDKKSTGKTTGKLTNNQQTINKQLTTNKNVKNVNNFGEQDSQGTNPLSKYTMGNIRLVEVDDEITYEDEGKPVKVSNRRKLYTRIALDYLQLKGEDGDVLRYFKDIKELVKKTEEALKSDKLEISDDLIIKAIKYRFGQADKKFDTWGFPALIKNFNSLVD